MLESYEVGAIFRVVDQSAATMDAIERRILAIDKAAASALKNMEGLASVRMGGLSTSLFGIDRRMTSIADKSATLRTAMVDNMEAVTTSMGEAAAMAVTFSAAMTEAATAARAIGSANLAGGGRLPSVGGGGAGGGAGGLHVKSNIPVGPMTHARLGMTPVLAAAAAVGYGAYEEANAEHSAMRMMFTAGLPIGGGPGDTNIEQIRSLVQSTMTNTGRSPDEVEKALVSSARLMGGMDFKKRMGVMPDIMAFAGQEAILKDVPMDQAATSLVELMHMTGQYEPDQMRAAAAKLAYISTISPLSLSGITKSASFAVPTLRAGLGMDPNGLLLLQGALQSAGITNTKAGTWEESFFRRLDPKTSLPGIVTKHGKDNQTKALKDLGMIDSKGKDVGLQMARNNDWRLFDILHEHMTSLDKAHPGAGMVAMQMAFGAQGARFGSMVQSDQFRQRLPGLIQDSEKFKTGPETLKSFLDNDPVIKFQSAMRELQSVLMDVGKVALPTIIQDLNMFNGVLTSIKGTIEQFIPLAKAGEDLAKLSKAQTKGLAEAGPAGAVYEVGKELFKQHPFSIHTNPANIDKSLGQVDPFRDGGFPSGGKSTTVNIGNVVIQSSTDTPAAHADAFIKQVTHGLNKSHYLNQGEGEGTFGSPFNSGGGP